MTWAEQCFALLPTHHPAAMLLTLIQTYPNWDISHSDQMCDNQFGDDRLAKIGKMTGKPKRCTKKVSCAGGLKRPSTFKSMKRLHCTRSVIEFSPGRIAHDERLDCVDVRRINVCMPTLSSENRFSRRGDKLGDDDWRVWGRETELRVRNIKKYGNDEQ